MINHARTLLMNVDGDATGYREEPGEEFIPPAFRALALPEHLQQLHAILFGRTPDRLMRNYRTRQYLSLLHTTELAEFVLRLDPRITYTVLPQDELFDELFTAHVRPLGTTTAQLFLLGETGSVNQAGLTQHRWQIRVLSGSTVEVRRLSQPLSQTVYDYQLTEQLSNPIPLPGSDLSFRFAAGIGSRWQINAVSRPDPILATLPTLLQAAGINLEIAFGIGTPTGRTEPWVTFRNLWHQHPELPYRIGGALLGWIYAANSVYEAR